MMHELSIAESLVALVNQHVPNGATLRRVKLRIGPLQMIVPDALHWGWEAATSDTPLGGSTLELDMLPWEMACPECGRRWLANDMNEVCSCGCETPTADGCDDMVLLSLTCEEPTPESAPETKENDHV